MVNINSNEINSVAEILEEFRENPHSYPGTYTARYSYGTRSQANAYAAARLERPKPFRMNGQGAYPWESILLAAATCGGSDYPMYAEHYGVEIDDVEVVLEADFDPRGEFVGLDPSVGAEPHCYRAFRWNVTLRSDAPRDVLEKIHARVLMHNMVLDALRAVPMESTLTVKALASAPRSVRA
jgi:uncharacterized OsmC-like protein